MRTRLLFLLACVFIVPMAFAQTDAPLRVVIDLKASTTPLPHFWEQMFGSGRAVLSLRESYRSDLRETEKITSIKYVRFHGILMDELGVYDEDAQGNPIYNFSYVDQVYDGLLANHVKPFVEISFMPRKLTSDPNALHAFWYKQNVAPPKDWNKWSDLMTAFGKHLVDRYGIDEVSTWYFEVWNEPNIDFWAGKPAQESYYKLYDTAARALKAVDPRIRVGGPATAQAAWVGDFIAHCASANVPVDFVSSHVYGNDSAKDVFHTNEQIPRDRMVCRAIDKVHGEIQHSSMPKLPLIWSEFNASYANETNVTDAVYMAPWLADTIRQCDGKVDLMSYWTFSDVFEEQGVIKQPFYGGFGILAEGGIPKPAYHAFALLHKLGEQRLAVNSENVLATRRNDGATVLAVWNLENPEEAGKGHERTIQLNLTGAHPRHATVYRVDATHGNVMPAYEQMGRPKSPTPAQIQTLIRAAQLPAPEQKSVKDSLELRLPVNGFALVELK